MNLETKITIYKFTPQVFTLTQNFCIMVYHINFLQSYKFNFNFHHVL